MMCGLYKNGGDRIITVNGYRSTGRAGISHVTGPAIEMPPCSWDCCNIYNCTLIVKMRTNCRGGDTITINNNF